MADKKRLDQIMVTRGLAVSRHQAQALIMAGNVLVESVPVFKPGTQVPVEADISLKKELPAYVSRGGLKLEAALHAYNLAVTGWKCLDAGASTGGFTDCLLQHGAAHVYAVDVGYGQLAWKLRQDKRVTVIERTNVRHMAESALPEHVDLVTIDTSFISLKIVVPAVQKFLKKDGRMVALIKPQFEVGKGLVGKGGVVRDRTLHEQVIAQLTQFFDELGFHHLPPITSPVLGPKGNQEYLILLYR